MLEILLAAAGLAVGLSIRGNASGLIASYLAMAAIVVLWAGGS